jgi:hypothetical protein
MDCRVIVIDKDGALLYYELEITNNRGQVCV